MKSLRELYKVGRGPSSSHTMGPEKASKYFLSRTFGADRYKVILYGSLASTGRGHRTDYAISETMRPFPVEIVFDTETEGLPHANTMDFFAYKDDVLIDQCRVMSVGGGEIRIEGHPEEDKPEIYAESSFKEILGICTKRKIRLSDFVFEKEDKDFRTFLYDIWQTMKEEID